MLSSKKKEILFSVGLSLFIIGIIMIIVGLAIHQDRNTVYVVEIPQEISPCSDRELAGYLLEDIQNELKRIEGKYPLHPPRFRPGWQNWWETTDYERFIFLMRVIPPLEMIRNQTNTHKGLEYKIDWQLRKLTIFHY